MYLAAHKIEHIQIRMKSNKKAYLTEILVSGTVLAILALGMSIAEFESYKKNISTEWYVGAIAFTFLGFGIWAGLKWRKSSSVNSNKSLDISIYSFSRREKEVFQLLIQGKSNQEISDSLSISLSTVKTHVSSIFVKMDVKSRAQAIARIQIQ